MKYNVNHKNYFTKNVVAEELVVEDPKVEEKTIEIVEATVEVEDKYSEKKLYALNKSEQIELLVELGLDLAEVKRLRYEKDRVQTILSLVYEDE